MSPVSNEPSFATMRCTVLSLFLQATVPAVAIVAGLGLNDCDPAVVVMLTVTEADVPPPPEGLGLVGLPPPPSPPHAPAASAMARAIPHEERVHMIDPPFRSSQGKKRTSTHLRDAYGSGGFVPGGLPTVLTSAVNPFVKQQPT
jgi:hypothetical protein